MTTSQKAVSILKQKEHSDLFEIITYLDWISTMLVIKFSLAVSVALICTLFVIAPSFGPLRVESVQAATNAQILRAMAARGTAHPDRLRQNGGILQ